MLDLEVIGEGATTKIYRNGDVAIKLYLNAPPGEVDNEARLQTFARDAGLPVPAVYGVHRLQEGMTALDMAYISGKTILHQQMDKDERNDAIAMLVKLQCAVHCVNADGLPKQADRLKRKINSNPHIDTKMKDRLLELLIRLDKGYGSLCHGDFHPLNILFDGERYWIIDWVDATAGNPLAGACRTYIIFKQHIARSSGIYLRSFCKEAKANQEDVLAWLPIVAAARLSERVDDKACAYLMKMVDEWYR